MDALVDASVAIKEGEGREASVARCASASAELSASFALGVARQACVSRLPVRVGTLSVALSFVQDKVVTCELIAAEAVVRVVWQASQAWQVACEGEGETGIDLVNRVGSAAVSVRSHLPRARSARVEHFNLLVRQGELKLSAGVLLRNQHVGDLDHAWLIFKVLAVNNSCLSKDARNCVSTFLEYGTDLRGVISDLDG